MTGLTGLLLLLLLWLWLFWNFTCFRLVFASSVIVVEASTAAVVVISVVISVIVPLYNSHERLRCIKKIPCIHIRPVAVSRA